MGITYCDHCNRQIDDDWEAEHFTSSGDCVEQQTEKWQEQGKTESEIEKLLEE